MIIKILILSCISAILYRLGGIGGKWYLNTKIRDLGVPICSLFVLYLCGIQIPYWVGFLTFLLMGASLTTYCTPKGQEDVKLLNWLLVGIMYGLTLIVVAFYTSWLAFGLRALVLIIAIPLISEKFSNVWIEEILRGFLFTATIPLFLI